MIPLALASLCRASAAIAHSSGGAGHLANARRRGLQDLGLKGDKAADVPTAEAAAHSLTSAKTPSSVIVPMSSPTGTQNLTPSLASRGK